MRKNFLLLISLVLLAACGKDEPDVQPANADDDFIVVEGEWDLEYRHIELYDSLHQKLAETRHIYVPGNWLQFISGGVFREFQNGRLGYSGTFSNQNNILTLKYHSEIHENVIDTLTLNRLVYHERKVYPNKDYHIDRTAAVRRK